jgi:ATP-dependent Clp protease ATP-binding subunit ClpX
MLEIMYELPDQPKGTRYEIDEDVVRGKRKLFPIQEPMQKSA